MKAFFQARSKRERLLLLAFALIGFAWWAPVALGRLGAFHRDLSTLREEGKTQQLVFSRRAEIEARVAAAALTLDAAKTLDASQAFAELNRMSAGLSAVITAQRTERTEQFAQHNVQVSIDGAEMEGLRRFYDQLSARSPYLCIEQCRLSAERGKPGTVRAVFRVFAIEVLRPEQ